MIAAGALAILPPKYRATTVVLVDPRQPHVTNTQAVIPGIGSDAAAVESQVELIESSSLARKIISKLHLGRDPEFASPSIIERISERLLAIVGRSPDIAADTQVSRLVSKFQSGLSVRRRGLTYVLEISYVSKDPVKAAQISGAVADAYLDDQRAAKTDMTARASGWLDERIDEMRARVRAAEEAVNAFKAANNIVDVTQGNKLISRQIEDVTQQLALARTRTADAHARLERVQQTARQSTDPATLNEALQSQVIAGLRSQYAEAARIQAEYGMNFGDKYPALIAVRAQVAELRRQIDNEISRILVGVRNDHQVAMSREASLETQLALLVEQAATLSQADVKLRELEREAQATRTLFEQFLNRVKETNEQQSLQIADARIVSPALRPIKPDRPAMPLLLAAAGSFGLILAIGLALLLEQTRKVFRSPSEIQQYLSLPCLGVLPQQTVDPTSGRWRLRNRKTKSSITPAERATASRYTLENAGSLYAENLQAVRARLQRSASKRPKEIWTIISALPGEGKSTFACNLALASASSGIRTLLIDGDIYVCSVSQVFQIKQAGFFELLHGHSTFGEVLTKDPKSGLYLIGARAPTSVAEKIKNPDETRLTALMREFRRNFDLVIIDTAAILPLGSSTPVLEYTDRAVLVVEWERTDREMVAEALDILDASASKITGVVLNKASADWYKFANYHQYLQYDSYARRAA
jgi:polysaccharide biosynthesis transport protein